MLAGKLLIEQQNMPAFPPLVAYEFKGINEVTFNFEKDDDTKNVIRFVLDVTELTLERYSHGYSCAPAYNASVTVNLDMTTGNIIHIDWCRKEYPFNVITFTELSDSYNMFGYDCHGNKIIISDTVRYNGTIGRIVGNTDWGPFTCDFNGKQRNYFGKDLELVTVENKNTIEVVEQADNN